MSFCLLMMSFDIQTLLILMVLTLSAFFFTGCTLLIKFLLQPKILEHAFIFSSKSFIFLLGSGIPLDFLISSKKEFQLCYYFLYE